jgi:hypothetical protein
MDLDITNYSTQDMIDLLDLKVVDRTNIIESTEHEMEKHSKDKDLVTFFEEIQTHLLSTLPKEPATTFSTEIKKGNMNPDIKNTITRLVNIDSSCRVNLFPNNFSSDLYDFDLSEPLLNVVSLSLYSVEIPQSWYANTKKKGNTSFILFESVFNLDTEPTVTRTVVTIPDGNYTTLSLPNVVAKTIMSLTTLTVTSTVSPSTGMCTFTITGFRPGTMFQFIWFDTTFSEPTMIDTRINSSLGWMLGFRSPITFVRPELETSVSMMPESLVDASGTKYVILALNDYKTNRINRSLVTVNTVPNQPLSQPSYYNESLPQFRISPTKVNVISTDPKQLTIKQLYTINAISNQTTLNQRFLSYDSSEIFAKLPLKKIDWGKYDKDELVTIDNGPSKLIIADGGPLQLQTREYFGPVDIVSMTVGLYDDKGKLLGLNGMDWSFTLVAKCIYQY